MVEPKVIFETERLIAREWTIEDADAAFAIYRDPEVTRYLGGTGQPDPDVAYRRARLERFIKLYDELPGYGLWALVERESGALVGAAELLPLDGGPEVEIGYHLGRPWWGKGYATELARALVAYAFGQLGLTRLVGVTYPENIASQRVLLKAGLTHAGRKHVYGHDMEYFVIEGAQGALGAPGAQ